MLFTDLKELKSIFEIDPDNKNEDKNLWFFAEWATRWVEEYLGRDVSFKERTWYYDGKGTSNLVLKHRPVYRTPTPRAWVDDGGFGGDAPGAFPDTTELVYGTDFVLAVDNYDTNTSRSGLLVHLGGGWPRFNYRRRGFLTPYAGPGTRNVKVVYSAGHTVDTLPATFRAGTVQMVAQMRSLFPLGLALSSENYEDRSISILNERKDYIMGLAKQWLMPYRNQVYF